MRIPASISSGFGARTTMRTRRLCPTLLSLPLALFVGAHCGGAENQRTEAKPAAAKISYYHEIRPILQANCQGCHQPAKNKGGYVMTDFKRLLVGGDNEGAAIVPKHADKSAIMKMNTPQDGEVRMPKGKTPLLDSEIALMS